MTSNDPKERPLSQNCKWVIENGGGTPGHLFMGDGAFSMKKTACRGKYIQPVGRGLTFACDIGKIIFCDIHFRSASTRLLFFDYSYQPIYTRDVIHNTAANTD